MTKVKLEPAVLPSTGSTSCARAAHESDTGFTLIELLVVVVIIGILIAIAIPLYLHFEQGGYDASSKADVHTLSLEEQNYNSKHNTFGATAQLVADNPNLKASNGTTELVVASDANHFCVAAFNVKGSHDASSPLTAFGLPDYKAYFYDSNTGSISTTPCSTNVQDGNLIESDGLH